MAKNSKEPELTPEQKALQERVDQMMDPKKDEVSQVAADVNQSLAKDFDTKEAEPVSKAQIEPPATAPELPGAEAAEPAAVADEPDAATESSEAPAEPSQSTVEPSADIDDSETDKAVDDIVEGESDTMLALEDAKLNKQKTGQAA